MQKAEQKNFGNPDEVRKFPNGRIELVKVGDKVIGRSLDPLVLSHQGERTYKNA